MDKQYWWQLNECTDEKEYPWPKLKLKNTYTRHNTSTKNTFYPSCRMSHINFQQLLLLLPVKWKQKLDGEYFLKYFTNISPFATFLGLYNKKQRYFCKAYEKNCDFVSHPTSASFALQIWIMRSWELSVITRKRQLANPRVNSRVLLT